MWCSHTTDRWHGADRGSARIRATILLTLSLTLGLTSHAQTRYTTRGSDIVDASSGETVLLRGFGLGGWLLPEGYMWDIRTLDRPRQFEAAIVDLIGEAAAAEFWRLYHDNYVTASDFRAMRAMGANSIRIALLASRLQPRAEQADAPPFVYSDDGFRFLDSVVTWGAANDLGIIWDMHGAPGGQNAENISDSDGVARLWTEKDRYWPRLIDLWYRIAERYRGNPTIIGYDLLNEPLLRRYEGVDPGLLRELYVILTDTIRAVDPRGLIFVEGDDWAQNFDMLEPIDWDPHLVLAFHSYPPTYTATGLKRWDDLRRKYDIPLWHGETGEQQPPYEINRRATSFLDSANVGWSWWTHKKLARESQPWLCPPTDGFRRILDFWKGRAERPPREKAREWLLEQARRTRSDYCNFLPDMVNSLVPFSADAYMASRSPLPPSIFESPKDVTVEEGYAARFEVGARGFPLNYTWYRDGAPIEDRATSLLSFVPTKVRDGSRYAVTVSNELGAAGTEPAALRVLPFAGSSLSRTRTVPPQDASATGPWETAERFRLLNQVAGRPAEPEDLAAWFSALWDNAYLYVLVEVTDRVARSGDGRLHHNDGAEIYLDCDNSKGREYGLSDLQLYQIRGSGRLEAGRGELGPGVTSAQVETEDGYRIEIAFPWSVLGCSPTPGAFLGIDVHVNDNDNDRRETKLAWAGRRDNAYQSPSAFGVLKLASD